MEVIRRFAPALVLLAACAHAPEPEPEAQVAEQPGTFAEGTVAPVRKKCRKGGPRLAERDRASGRIVLDFVVTEDGKVKDVTVAGDASAGAVKAIRAYLASCSYQPATQDGKPVAVKWRGELTFPTRAPAPR
jgi:TonB family protein